MSSHGSTTSCTFMFENFGFYKKLYKEFIFSRFGCIFLKIRDGYFKELLILRILMLFSCIFLKIAIFGNFSNINQFSTKNGIPLRQLYPYNSKRFRKEIQHLCKDVKIMNEEVCKLSRRYLYRYGRYSRKSTGRGSDSTSPRRSRDNGVATFIDPPPPL